MRTKEETWHLPQVPQASFDWAAQHLLIEGQKVRWTFLRTTVRTIGLYKAGNGCPFASYAGHSEEVVGPAQGHKWQLWTTFVIPRHLAK